MIKKLTQKDGTYKSTRR